MVHNGIEYGMMQALAEGFSILKAKKKFDLERVSHIWQYGSVVRSWLLDLAARALQQDSDLADIEPWVADSGKGRWTVFEFDRPGCAGADHYSGITNALRQPER